MKVKTLFCEIDMPMSAVLAHFSARLFIDNLPVKNRGEPPSPVGKK
jgi:hypothetical protein